jgi:SAM-dependent methyltransferase
MSTVPVKGDLQYATNKLYRAAAAKPDVGLCCTTTPVWKLPGLSMPQRMLQMNYGCGSTVHPRDLDREPTVLYVGIGGGMELLQFAYFSRRPGAVIGVEILPEMIEACRTNFDEAERLNPWFDRAMVDLRQGDALELPVPDASVDVASQNCVFNIFRNDEARRAVAEMYRVLKPHGRLVMSDPICEAPMPQHLRDDERLRAQCLSGALPLAHYVKLLTDAGFGTIEVRARRPYRVLDTLRYGTVHPILVESVEVCAIKDPMPVDGPCIFTGRTAILHGNDPVFDDGKGHMLQRDVPLAVCDKTADALASLGRNDLYITPSTWHYDGGGCC